MLILALALAMATPDLTLHAEAKGKPSNDDLFITLTITNNSNTPAGFPLEFRQKTGPAVKLTDTRTKAHTYLRTNLADLALRQKLTPIPPHKSVTLEWLIHPSELQQFGTPIDLTATFTLESLTTDLHITSK
jgi:hypothetical protein